MRKLIETNHKALIVCDNTQCNYEYPYTPGSEKNVIRFVNMPCPDCGENLLTEEDFRTYAITLAIVSWVNRWFSWLTFFYPKNAKKKSIYAHIYKGVKFTDEDGSI